MNSQNKTNQTNHTNHTDKARAEYDAIDALNYTGMKELLKSPLHYQQWLKNRQNKEDTKALRIGKMTHEAILQPDLFQRYKSLPDCDRRTKEGKELWLHFIESLKPNEIAVAQDEYELSLSMSDAVHQALEQKGIQFSETEQIKTAEFSGVNFKCLVDAIGTDGVIYDIKTTDDASLQGFKRTALSYKYYLQAFLYKSIAGLNDFVFVVVEKEPPHAVAFYRLGQEFMNKGSEELLHAVTLYSKSMQSGKWDGYSTDIVDLDLPSKSSMVIPFA